MSAITTHVLDTAAGRPAAGVPLLLELQAPGGAWQEVGRGETDADGRNRHLLPENRAIEPATYRLTFETGAYFDRTGTAGFYPYVQVVFAISEPVAHYHVPLLLSPFGYSTYRGS